MLLYVILMPFNQSNQQRPRRAAGRPPGAEERAEVEGPLEGRGERRAELPLRGGVGLHQGHLSQSKNHIKQRFPKVSI